MKKSVTMREALADPTLLGNALPGDSWAAWRIILIAAMGEELTDDERVIFTKLTGGREREPGGGVPVETMMVVAGRRSGKSCALSILAVYLSCLCDWSEHLRVGERGVCLYQAPTARQASEAYRYSTEFIGTVPLLAELVENKVEDCLSLRRSIEIRAVAANWRYSRGTTSIMCLLDECAFFRSGEDADNSDEELLTALMPSLGTTSGIMCIASSPKAMEGIVYDIHKRHFGKDGDPQVLVIHADTKSLNPTFRDVVIQRALAADPLKASAEYMGEFREQTSGYLERSILDAAVEKGVARRVPLPGIKYRAFVDPSGGGSDSYTTAIGHNVIDGDRTISVIDCVYEAVPPFDPEYVTRQAAATLKEWKITEVYGDAYAGAWPVTAMSRNGIRYITAPLSASELYLHTLPLWTSGRVRMLDHEKTMTQFARLRRRVGQGVQEKIIHPKSAHDDLANAVAGVLWRLSPVEHNPTTGISWGGFGAVTKPREYAGSASYDDIDRYVMSRYPGSGGNGNCGLCW
jgi:hypothetical protein